MGCLGYKSKANAGTRICHRLKYIPLTWHGIEYYVLRGYVILLKSSKSIEKALMICSAGRSTVNAFTE